MRRSGLLTATAILLALTATGARADAVVMGLGDLDGGSIDSVARGVSADGSTVVGWSTSASGIEAFRWTATTGMEGLGDLDGGIFRSTAFGVSADGSVVVGTGTSASGNQAFRWTAATGMVGLGDLPGGLFSSFAYGVSADGSVVVGQGSSNSGLGSTTVDEAFRWTQADGMVGLGDLTDQTFTIYTASSRATAVSADGSVVVGKGSPPVSGTEAFRWTQADGMVGLGDLPGSPLSSQANAVSRDGSVVVGKGVSDLRTEAFR